MNPSGAVPLRHPPSAMGPRQRFQFEVGPTRGIVPPLSNGAERLHVTVRWASVKFLAAYQVARDKVGDDALEVVNEIYARELPDCLKPPSQGGWPVTAQAIELARRVQLSVAVLMRSEGVDAQMPFLPSYPQPNPSPPLAPWLRALLTGWP